MFAKGQRLPRETFTKRPVRRVRFQYGNISFFDTTPIQTAVIVSKKVARSAVDRNRLRRRVLHALRKVASKESIAVYPTKEALTTPFSELVDAFVKSFLAR